MYGLVPFLQGFLIYFQLLMKVYLEVPNGEELAEALQSRVRNLGTQNTLLLNCCSLCEDSGLQTLKPA